MVKLKNKEKKDQLLEEERVFKYLDVVRKVVNSLGGCRLVNFDGCEYDAYFCYNVKLVTLPIHDRKVEGWRPCGRKGL